MGALPMSVAELPQPKMTEAAFIRQARQICNDLMAHNQAIYWVDFLASVTVAWVSLIVCLTAEMWSATQIISFIIAGLMLYRSSVFTHELAHLPPSRYRAFRIVWNVLFGIPFLVPTFLYTDHRVHHTSQTYGTGNDAEYFPFARRSMALLLGSQLIMFIMPLMPVIRFGILGPISLLHPKIRKWVWEKGSSMGSITPSYSRGPADADERRAAAWQEPACFLWITALVVAVAIGAISWTSVALIYAVYVYTITVNNVRVYAAHHYISSGEPMTFLDQMLDSTTIPTIPGALWAPLGMRYHALHHLFPTMPYHNMGAAHRRLMRQLPPDSPYHQTLVPNLATGVMNLVREVRSGRLRLGGAATPAGR
jgi:fatty acid desaturase